MATALTVKHQKKEKMPHHMEERTTALFNSTDTQGTLTTGILIASQIQIQGVNMADISYPVVTAVGGVYALNGKLTIARNAGTSAGEINVLIKGA